MAGQIVSVSRRSPKALSSKFAPLAASARAMPRTIPLVEAVTMADLPTSILTGVAVGIALVALINIAHPLHPRRKRTKARETLFPSSAAQPSRRSGVRSAILREREVIGEMPVCYEIDAYLLLTQEPTEAARNGDAPDPLFPGGSGGTQLHARRREVQRDATRPDAAEPETRSGTRRTSAPS